MKLGVSAFAWTSKFDRYHLTLIPKVKEMGFSGFEIAIFDPADLPVSEIRHAFESSDLECTICAILPPGINPISPEAAIRKKSVQHLVCSIETSAELGARLLGGPLYAPIGYLPDHRPTQDEWSWAVEAFQAVTETLDACNVNLNIEPVNRSETFFLRTAKEAKSMCEAVCHPRVGVTIDTFHANIEERSIPAAVESLGPYMKHLHVSENDRGLLGEGHVDFPAIVAALQKGAYNGYLMIEGFGYSPEEKNGPGVLWADVSVSPEEIATCGLQYLGRILNLQKTHVH